jgi:hypothetical protein
MRPFAFVRSALGLMLWVTVTLAACSWNWRQVFFEGQVYFVDPDCYSRMRRVQQVMAAPWSAVKFHDFENAPKGVVPHTTAPMDLLIAAMAGAFKLAFWISGSRSSASVLDLAGAFISPFLGAALIAFLWWWGRKLALPYRNAMLALAALSPIVAHGFQLGRPDHQSLIIFLIGAALAAEIAIWKQPSHAWEILSALLWALALWTSLFEPLVLFGATLLMRFVVRGIAAIPNRKAIVAFVLLVASMLFFEGWRVRAPSAEEGSYFFRWALNIGELRHGSLSQLFCWTGWLLVVSPILLFWRSWAERNSAYGTLATLLLLLTALSLWHMRWGYFLAIVAALSLPFALAVVPRKSVGWLAFAISLWPVAEEWERQLYPNAEQEIAREQDRQESYLLRETARTLISTEGTIILAPWWLSSAIAYWSGQRCVSGSSHQSLPGIIDSSRFYLSTDPKEAREILAKRSVNYVIAYEPSRVIANSAQILGRAPPKEPLGETIYKDPESAPSFLRAVYKNQLFKVFEFVDRS